MNESQQNPSKEKGKRYLQSQMNYQHWCYCCWNQTQQIKIQNSFPYQTLVRLFCSYFKNNSCIILCSAKGKGQDWRFIKTEEEKQRLKERKSGFYIYIWTHTHRALFVVGNCLNNLSLLTLSFFEEVTMNPPCLFLLPQLVFASRVQFYTKIKTVDFFNFFNLTSSFFNSTQAAFICYFWAITVTDLTKNRTNPQSTTHPYVTALGDTKSA